MVKFKGIKLVLQLKASSPMIHFQAEQIGATLRASEVKPKFDKYLLKIIGNSASLSSYLIDSEHKALNYKMRIENSNTPTCIELNKYKIFYGNSGRKKNGEKDICGLFSDPKVIITCFNGELREIIEKNIIDFFLSHNFGMMQSKGFGSFVPDELNFSSNLSEKDKERVAQALKNTYESKYCFSIEFDKLSLENDDKFEVRSNYYYNMFDEIKQFYGIMKSGQNFNGYARSFLFEYMHEKYGIDNEKAWMKQKKIAPIVSKNGNNGNHDLEDENSRYVRALLGTAESVSFAGKSGKKIVVSIKSIDKSIERFSSPIFFKIVMNTVFIVALRVPDGLYGKAFEFSSKMGKSTIKIPEISDFFPEELFDTNEFLKDYVAYYNNEKSSGGGYIENKLYKTNFQYTVEEVK